MENLFYLSPVDGRKSFYNKAAIVATTDGLTLLSYGTPVAHWDIPNRRFTRMWSGYSVTTMRHINAFMRYLGSNLGGKKWWDSLPVDVSVEL